MFRVFAIDTEGGYDDHAYAAGTISASSNLVAGDDAASQTLFAGLGVSGASLTPEQTQYIEYAISGQDPESGRPPAADTNPHAKDLTAAQIAEADSAVQGWLRLGDNEIWENLAAALEREGNRISLPLQVKLIQLCKQVKTRTDADRNAIEVYNKQWTPSSRFALVKELARTSSIAEMCSYMSTYRPSGLLRNPPFEAGAEAVLVAISHKWPKLQ